MAIWDSYIGKLFMTVLVSMVPVIELRGAIPIATAHGLPMAVSIPCAIVGNLIPVPFIILFIRKIFHWMRRKSQRLGRLVTRLENRAMAKSKKVERYAFWGLVLLVAIPLPGTGAWTGALVAALMDIRLKRAFPAIVLGVCIAGAVVALVTFSTGQLLF